ERAFEPRDQAGQLLFARTGRIGRRHQPAAQLAHGQLERIRVVGDPSAGDPVQREIAGVVVLGVALDAVAIDRLPMLLAGFGDRRLFADLSAACRKHQRRERSRLSYHSLECTFRTGSIVRVPARTVNRPNHASGERYGHMLSIERTTNASGGPIKSLNSLVGSASRASLGPPPA